MTSILKNIFYCSCLYKGNVIWGISWWIFGINLHAQKKNFLTLVRIGKNWIISILPLLHIAKRARHVIVLTDSLTLFTGRLIQCFAPMWARFFFFYRASFLYFWVEMLQEWLWPSDCSRASIFGTGIQSSANKSELVFFFNTCLCF